jgi:hypothetical protein
MDGENVEGIWGSIRGNQKKVGEYKEEGMGALVGYTREINEGVRIMPMLSVSKEDVSGSKIGNNIEEQGRGERKTVGVGVGAGLDLNEVGVKVMVMGEKGEVSTNRRGKGERGKEEIAKGEFGTTGIGFGAKAEYKIELNKNAKIVPNVGFTAMSIKREKYEEKGGENAVRVEGMNYAKNIVNTGVDVEVKEKKYKLKAGLGVDIIVSGEQGRATGYGNTSFYGDRDGAGIEYKKANRVKLESVSTEQGKVIGKANVGAEYEISRRVNVGIEVSAEKGKGSQSVSGKVNAKYDFGRKRYYGRRLRVAKNNVMRVLKERKEYVQEELEKKKEELAKAKSK